MPFNRQNVAHYDCKKINSPISINGDLTKPQWATANKSPRFVDMVTGAPALYDTRTAALWDDNNLYIAFWAEEPQVSRHANSARQHCIFGK